MQVKNNTYSIFCSHLAEAKANFEIISDFTDLLNFAALFCHLKIYVFFYYLNKIKIKIVLEKSLKLQHMLLYQKRAYVKKCKKEI